MKLLVDRAALMPDVEEVLVAALAEIFRAELAEIAATEVSGGGSDRSASAAGPGPRQPAPADFAQVGHEGVVVNSQQPAAADLHALGDELAIGDRAADELTRHPHPVRTFASGERRIIRPTSAGHTASVARGAFLQLQKKRRA